MEKHLEYIGINIDRLAALEIRGQRPDQGLIDLLYWKAREVAGAPLTMLAAQRLVNIVREEDVVIINTGSGTPPVMPKGETDGPLGAVAIARALRYGLGAIPIILTETAFVRAISSVCVAAGLAVRDLSEVNVTPFSCVVDPFPEDDIAEKASASILSDLKPKAVIAIEELGPNAKGVAHNSVGKAIAGKRSKSEYLFNLARKEGILTIGIGDNGNEIGFGLIEDAVREFKEYGDMCQCPCEGGLACAIPADILIVSGTSNWGGYGLEACLAASLEQPELIRGPDIERRMLEEFVRMGAVDASTGKQAPTVDGTSLEVQIHILELMKAVVKKGLQPGRIKIT